MLHGLDEQVDIHVQRIVTLLKKTAFLFLADALKSQKLLAELLILLDSFRISSF